MNRRHFLSLLAAVPIVGRLVPKAAPVVSAKSLGVVAFVEIGRVPTAVELADLCKASSGPILHLYTEPPHA